MLYFTAMSDNNTLFEDLLRIRRFEEAVLDNFPKGVFFGTTHTYLGQEANAVGVLDDIHSGDIVFSNHRGHGHFLAYGGAIRSLFAELMGKTTGVCGGRGGSQHLQWQNFYSNGVQGGIVPIATGMALAEKRKGSDVIVIAFMGDGTLGEGVVYEALNMASLWQAPILFVLENNRIAQTTPIEMAVAGDISARFNAFNITVRVLDSSDVKEILPVAAELIAEVRSLKSPHTLILNTYRFGPHSKGDDIRDKHEINQLRMARDPILIHARRLDSNHKAAIELKVEKDIQEAFDQALADPLTDASKALTGSINYQ
jgi:TPP-dependent pyruvate/acetoin dehydrogenase alpha subunit